MVDYTDPRWNESDSQNTAPSPNGIATGSAPSAVPAVIRAGMGAQKRAFDRENAMGLLTNSGNAYTLTYDVPPDDYVKGQFFSFFVNAANTGSATLRINGLSPKTIVNITGTVLAGGELVPGTVITVTYDGTNFRMVNAGANPMLVNVASTNVSASGAMTLKGKTVFTVDNDGAGSGFDSDLLDGQQGSWYQSRANHTGTQTASTISDLQGLLDAIVPAGIVVATASTSIPAGYIYCNGGAVSRTQYARLFAAIGTVHGGGDGSTTFNVPDLRGVFVRGHDNGRGIDGGRGYGSYQDMMVQSHAHGVNDPGHGHGVYDPGHTHTALGSTNSTGQGSINTGAGGNNLNANVTASGTGIGIYGNATGISIQAAGGNETRPRNVALHYCIKA